MSKITDHKNRRFNVHKLVFSALLMAIHAVLSAYVSIDAKVMKFTFEGLPIILGGLMYGPVDGMIIGFLGSFLGQLIGQYGLSVTTVMWIFPHGMRGLLVGWYAKYHDYKLDDRQLLFITVLSALVTTALNTPVMYFDALIFQYDTEVLLPANIISRVVAGIIVAILFAVIIRKLMKRLSHFMGVAGAKGRSE